MTHIKRPVTPSPFPGRPMPIGVVRLFLLEPETLLKLYGPSMKKIMKKKNLEHQYDYLQQRHQDGTTKLPAKTLHALTGMIRERDEEVASLIERSADGDLAARDLLALLGPWGATVRALDSHVSSLSSVQYLLRLERTLLTPELHILNGRYDLALKGIASNDVCGPYVHDEDALRQLLPHALARPDLVAPMILDAALSVLAALSVDYDGSNASDVAPCFDSLLPRGDTSSGDFEHPAQRFFQRFLSHLNLNDARELVEKLSWSDAPNLIEEPEKTFQRWRNGENVPERRHVHAILNACGDDKEVKQSALADHRIMRYLHCVTWLWNEVTYRTNEDQIFAPAQQLPAGVQATPSREHRVELADLTNALWSCQNTSCGEWFSERFQHWRTYHNERTTP